jgi:FkbM family methyltransferase
MAFPVRSGAWRSSFARAAARTLWALPIPAGKWRLAHGIADLLVAGTAARPEIADMADGFRLSLDLRDTFQRRIFFAGTYDPRATRLFKHILMPGDTVVDGGANIGYFSLLAATLVGVRGAVHAFEPMPGTFAALSANIRLNLATAIQANCLALSSAPGTLHFSVRTDGNLGSATSLAQHDGPTFAAPAEALDTYAVRAGLDTIKLVKLDLEGGELAALEGMRRLLSEHRISYLISEVNPTLLHAAGGTGEMIRAILQEFGYRCYSIGLLGRLRPVTSPLPEIERDYLFVAPLAPLPAVR